MEFIRENLLKIILFVAALIIAIVVFTLVFGKKSVVLNQSYSSMENTLLSASKKYVNDNKKLLPTANNESTKINLDTLVKAEYIKELSAIEDNNVICSGYTNIEYNDGNYAYTPYLKCGKYYETSNLANYIINNQEIVVTGDGLYKIGDNRYVYRGETPNNYVVIGQRTYRIIEIVDNEVRLISNERLKTRYVWDNRYNKDQNKNVGINTYSKSRLKEYLNNLITNDNSETSIFSNQEREKIVMHDVCIGKRSLNYGSIDSSNECKEIEANQKLSLLTVSDYARASIDSNCNTIYDRSCANYNYFSTINSSFSTVTATSDNTYQVFYITNGVATLTKASSSFNINFVIYLNNSSLYNSGDGSLENPYTIR